MFSALKQDIITKEISKEKNNIIDKCKINNNDSLVIHKKLENLISKFYDKKIYSKSGFTYDDLINRKNKITKYNSNSNDIGVSFVLGVLGNLFVSIFSVITDSLDGINPIFFGIFMIVFTLLVGFSTLYFIMYLIKFSSDTDKYHIYDFELSKIDELIEEYEKSK